MPYAEGDALILKCQSSVKGLIQESQSQNESGGNSSHATLAASPISLCIRSFLLAGALLPPSAASVYCSFASPPSPVLSPTALRCALTASLFGDVSEAHFWATLPRALVLLAQVRTVKAP